MSSLHANCINGWIVYTQRMSVDGGGWGEPTSTRDVYTDEVEALKCRNATLGDTQHSWVTQVRVHIH